MTGRSFSPIVSESVLKRRDYPVFILLSILSIFATGGFLWHWFSSQDWLENPASYSLMTIILMAILISHQGRWFLLPYMKKPKPLVPRAGLKVAVVTSFVPGAEPLEMLEQTVNALVNLNYPHDTWVLDEGDDERVRALCRKLGASHFSRKHLPAYLTDGGIFQRGTKYGNYNAWFHKIGFDAYEIITTFDPDHIPSANYLTSVIGYFDDPKVAYVQVAPYYYNRNASFIARGAAGETYEYYSVVQMASYSMGYPIIVGSHNTHRVTALKQLGGFPAHDAEDLLLTLRYRASGWQGVYVPEILAKGLTPVDWGGYLRQQRRWARSVLDIKVCRYFEFSRNLSVKSKLMSVLHGLNFLHKSILIFLGLILTNFMLATGSTPSVVSYQTIQMLVVLWLVLQGCEFYRQRFYLDPPKEWGIHWRVALLQYAKWPWFLLALLDVLLSRRVSYILTPKVKSRSRSRLLFLPNLLVVILLCSAWLIGRSLGSAVHPVVYICALLFVIASMILIWTDFWDFPAPFQKPLRITAQSNRTTVPVA
jgi:cellulose synthase/poly-beta-1,6-N-acetylglucosamine synthase-like glycosyltransferase